ncbi:2-methylcitrate dehydratase PrpD [Roseovarius azorensis]|uniref:2-methylcitrate dehydratase PrpD n=1 Tax=Roseovarius azorensis TaxID=1287727 RepID=A0A1H7XRL8_9RHOB|nr:MmgE/PrpD family protein [Roseovarius azorensis]SEM36401.1 2-methylcitrate dehydratase PrpD [Roseovarius azorensis]
MAFIDDIIDLAQMPTQEISAAALTLARFSLLDWAVCGRAGISEPLSGKLRQLAEREAGTAAASVFGAAQAPARMAALVNGATSHALDFDDTHFAHIGHLSVGIYPAAFAVGETRDLTAREVITAFAVGAEAAIRIGIVLGTKHYNHGFHQTATAGAFGATVAAGRLFGLSDAQMRNAIGLCATRASGLKSQFGTMGKPYNAGIAASNGVECAQLAALDFTSAEDALMGEQGFVATHCQGGDVATAWATPPRERFLFEDNKYKLHACCHGLHAMIEALLVLDLKGRDLAEVAALEVRTNPRWLRVCDKKRPATGLEVKFSYAWLAGMTLRGDTTGSDRSYSDAVAGDPNLAEFANKVTVTGDADLTDTQVAGAVRFADGTSLPLAFDLMAPLPPDVLETKLRDKAVAVLADAGAAIWDRLDVLPEMTARDAGKILIS